MTGTIIQCILLLIAHASVGIYSSTLKFRKKTTYIIWGTWIVFQTAILIYTEFVLTDRMMQFFAGFVLSLVGQYVIYFLTTKGKLAQRIFTMMTYSLLFCIGNHGKWNIQRVALGTYHAHSGCFAFCDYQLLPGVCVSSLPHCGKEHYHGLVITDFCKYRFFNYRYSILGISFTIH